MLVNEAHAENKRKFQMKMGFYYFLLPALVVPGYKLTIVDDFEA